MNGVAEFECFLDNRPVSVVIWKSGSRIPFDANAVPNQASPHSMEACLVDGTVLLGAAFLKRTFTPNAESLPQVIEILAGLEARKLAMKLALGASEDIPGNVFITEPFCVVSDVEGELVRENRRSAVEVFENIIGASSCEAMRSLFEYSLGCKSTKDDDVFFLVWEHFDCSSTKDLDVLQFFNRRSTKTVLSMPVHNQCLS